MKTTVVWAISHGLPGGDIYRTGLIIRDLGQALQNDLLAEEWQVVARLFEGEPLTIAPTEADRMVGVLYTASSYQLTDLDMADEAYALAFAAARAARSNESWTWRQQ